MKHQRTFLSIALLASLVAARPSRAGPSASTTIPTGIQKTDAQNGKVATDPALFTTIPTEKQKIHWFTPTRTTGTGNNLRLVEGLSTRAWTTTVGWHPGASAFPDAEMYGPRMRLFWIGHEPWQHVNSPIDR